MASNYKFEWNYSKSLIVARKGFGRELNRYLAEQVAMYSEPYVPYKTGTLNDSVQIKAYSDHASIIYHAPYVGPQYTGMNGSNIPESEWKRDTSTHPLATSYWDKYAWSQNSVRIGKAVAARRRSLSK